MSPRDNPLPFMDRAFVQKLCVYLCLLKKFTLASIIH